MQDGSFFHRWEKHMKFRPCIDIHNGKVKQIVGGSLNDQGDQAETNFASELDAAYYAKLYKKDGLTGGHMILLNAPDSPYYEADKSRRPLHWGSTRGDCRSEAGSRRRMRARFWKRGPAM